MSESDKDKLFKIAFSKEGLQTADIAYYLLLFLPMLAGFYCGYIWIKATVWHPEIPEERLTPLFWTSCILIGVPVAGGYAKNGK
ncbi:hypothetical protein [Picosynechococcus sp. PCC 8807]|uniref:hypothetical protein n=1 Tax=Picosynechococcus sp. PCC 8807 TaxID=195248 RepID=UPI000810BBC9|nr:hypothetical protein [Picosynechococcus sp. PCC 8807]ANV92028.1 hypothetical protein AWQ24_14710 [Picosynechococcus sp. PCC 8807]